MERSAVQEMTPKNFRSFFSIKSDFFLLILIHACSPKIIVTLKRMNKYNISIYCLQVFCANRDYLFVSIIEYIYRIVIYIYIHLFKIINSIENI